MLSKGNKWLSRRGKEIYARTRRSAPAGRESRRKDKKSHDEQRKITVARVVVVRGQGKGRVARFPKGLRWLVDRPQAKGGGCGPIQNWRNDAFEPCLESEMTKFEGGQCSPKWILAPLVSMEGECSVGSRDEGRVLKSKERNVRHCVS